MAKNPVGSSSDPISDEPFDLSAAIPPAIPVSEGQNPPEGELLLHYLRMT